MKPKTLARILCVILCIVLVGSVLLAAIPMMNADAAEHTPVLGGGGIVTEDYVNLRSDASTDASVVTVMRWNTPLTFLDTTLYNGDWYKVREQATGKTGFLMQEYLEADVPEQGIALSATRASTYVGCQYAFAQTGADNPQWETSDTDIATVSQHGVLTAKKAGDVILTVREGNKFASAIVAVLDGVSTGISRPSMTVQRGDTVTLTATAEVNWYSSNNGVATVSGGVVKGVAPPVSLK